MTILKKLYQLHRRMPTLLPGILLILIIALPGSLFKPALDMDLTMLDGSRINLAPCESILWEPKAKERTF